VNENCIFDERIKKDVKEGLVLFLITKLKVATLLKTN
jgi:hypothetical protein